MAFDFIEHSKRIETSLKQAGCTAAARDFEDVRLGGSTSGEILMGLRHVCMEAQTDHAIPAELKAEMVILAAAIDETGAEGGH